MDGTQSQDSATSAKLTIPDTSSNGSRKERESAEEMETEEFEHTKVGIDRSYVFLVHI